MAVYFSGQKLFGDDFTPERLMQWYRDEEDAYANLARTSGAPYIYTYHVINQRLGFRHLPKRRWQHALGIGSARGDEFIPIAGLLDKVTILEPGRDFVQSAIAGLPVTYVAPDPLGTIPFADNTFDLTLCLHCLHHVANVSYVVRELARCLRPGGYIILREPISSMADWRKPRPGLTPHERGIPAPLFLKMVHEAGLVVKAQRFGFSPIVRVLWPKILRTPPYSSKVATLLDDVLCHLTCFRMKYYRTSFLDRLKPGVVSIVAMKPA